MPEELPGVERAAQMLGFLPYPEGMAWRCRVCHYVCSDDGPDLCPVDGGPLTRVMANLPWADRDRRA